MRAIQLYCDLVSGSVLDGLQAELAASGVDVGARAEIPEVDFAESAAGADEVEAGLDSALPSEPEAAVAGNA
jgi:small subunit ribosomal protein S2